MEEWSTKIFEYGEPTLADERLASRLRSGDSPVGVEWLRGGRMKVETKAWVGLLRFTRQEIRIVPKLVGSDLGVLKMIDYCGSLRSLRRFESARTIKTGGENLLDLICQLLNEESDTLLREGLLQDYVAREEALPTLRGRLRHRDQAMRRFGQVNILECAYDEFEGNILENRVIGAGLLVARAIGTNSETRERSSRLSALFSEVCDAAPVDPILARANLVYHRRNEHYRPGHEWALLLLEASAIRELFDVGDRRVSVFLINMNTLFEKFVTKLIQEAFAGSDVRIRSQQSAASVIIDEDTQKTYAKIRPDLLLDAPSKDWRRVLPIDAKYKLYDGQTVAQSDIYQTFMYAIAYSDPTMGVPASLIIYPGKGTGRARTLSILKEAKVQSAHIYTVSVDVPTMLTLVTDPATRQSGLMMLRTICQECMAA
jgi:5-methylcytosine-specific restriction enzyme subunit McrC